MAAMTPTQHILVVANETATGDDLHRTVRAFAADPAARVHVVAPALNDASAPAAEQRLRMCIAQLEDLGLDVHGHVGDPDRAIDGGTQLILRRPCGSSQSGDLTVPLPVPAAPSR
jgi:hypothetical protein